jgi:uncharacterized protein YjiS (DUF1127 family)
MSPTMRLPLQNVSTHPIAALGIGAGKLASLSWRIRAALVARRQRRALMALDERMLSDIGLSRSQAYCEASRKFLDLPERHR